MWEHLHGIADRFDPVTFAPQVRQQVYSMPEPQWMDDSIAFLNANPPELAQSREDAMYWMCLFHNRASLDAGNGIVDCERDPGGYTYLSGHRANLPGSPGWFYYGRGGGRGGGGGGGGRCGGGGRTAKKPAAKKPAAPAYNVWAPKMWTDFNNLANNSKDSKGFATGVHNLISQIPCASCKQNSENFVKANPPEHVSNEKEAQHWVCLFHSDENQHSGLAPLNCGGYYE